MRNYINDLFALDRKPRRGLLPVEWAVLAYTVLTSLVIIVCYTHTVNPEAMVWGRLRVVFTMGLLWAVYRLLPCRLTLMARVVVQMALLAWWYPDTYELNRMFANMDHVFAQWEQTLFGCQPALLFSEVLPWPLFSELMDMGYAAYYPMIVLTALFYFLWRYKEFYRATFVIMAAFFAYYVVFIFVPVTGPTFYFNAIGVDKALAGVFPAVGDYFNSHQDCLPSPGYADGLFYQLVEDAKAAGERPTAAFPSSHVGISTVLMLLAWHAGSRRLFFIMLPFFVLMFFATVYIQAHYAIDALAGLVSGALLFAVLMLLTRRMT